MGEPPRNLQHLLAMLRDASGDDDQLSVREMFDAVGRRSFGPVLLLCGAIVFSPLSGIPGLSSLVAALVLLIAVQLLLRRSHFWVPEWLLRRQVGEGAVRRAVAVMLPVARFIDRLVHPRLTFLTGPIWARMVALACTLVALAMPPLEVLPFANTAMGATLTLFGLALITRDGLLVLLGFSICAGGVMLALSLF